MPVQLSLPGREDMVPVACLAASIILAGEPRAQDAERIVEVLATAAVKHSRSGEVGGCFHLALDSQPGRLRIEVTDQGPLPTASQDGAADYSKGIDAIAAMTAEWGVDMSADHGATRWAELEWRDQG